MSLQIGGIRFDMGCKLKLHRSKRNDFYEKSDFTEMNLQGFLRLFCELNSHLDGKEFDFFIVCLSGRH